MPLTETATRHLDLVRSILAARRRRDAHLPSELFGEPAWDLLLDLYAFALLGRRVSVSSACLAAAVPPTTALRQIGVLIDAGLCSRKADPFDRRRHYLGLTERGLASMEQLVEDLLGRSGQHALAQRKPGTPVRELRPADLREATADSATARLAAFFGGFDRSRLEELATVVAAMLEEVADDPRRGGEDRC